MKIKKQKERVKKMGNSFFCKYCKKENEFDDEIYFDSSDKNARDLEYLDGFYVGEELILQENCVFCKEKNEIQIEGDLEVEDVTKTLFTISNFKIKEGK
jgi:hypothetical protein